MTIANPSPETNAAIALLFGADEDAAIAAEAASPTAGACQRLVLAVQSYAASRG